MLSNIEFFDIVSAALSDQQTAAKFYRAEITGRELRLYFIDASSRRDDILAEPGHTFATGWYFSNREDVGQAIKGALCVFTKFGVAFEQMTPRTKIIHTGADLVGRMNALATAVASRNVDIDALTNQVRRLRSMSLNFSDKKAEQDKAMRHWTNYLSGFKVKSDTATAIVKNAMLVGADLRPRDPLDAYSRTTLSKRNLYDLACSVLRISKDEYSAYRDLLQGVAMQMLVPVKEGLKVY
jgi:hypothetical protein